VPKKAREIVDVRSLARVHTASAMRRIEGLAENGKSEGVRLEANKILLDRGWGRPSQEIRHVGTGEQGAIEIIVRHIGKGSKAPRK